MQEIIDAHVHLGLKSFCEQPGVNFPQGLDNTYEDTIQLMERNGIAQAVALPVPHRFIDTNVSNAYVYEAYTRYPDRFIPFCRIDENLETNLEKGFRGVKLHFVYEDVDIKKLKPYLQVIEDSGVPLMIHASFRGKVNEIRQILKYAPNINIILAHMGRGHIYTGEQVTENAVALKEYPNLYMDCSTVGDIPSILNVCEIMGYHKIFYGSDYPFGRNYFGADYDYMAEVNRLSEVLTDTQAKQLFHDNILALLLKSSPSSLRIRRTKASDVAPVMELLNSLEDRDKKYLAYSHKRTLIRSETKKGRHCFLAVLNNQIVGFMRESGRPDNYSLLEEIVVLPRFRGQGIAKALLRYYHNAFQKTLSKTNAGNQAMIHLLRSHGYQTEDADAPRIVNWKRDGSDSISWA